MTSYLCDSVQSGTDFLQESAGKKEFMMGGILTQWEKETKVRGKNSLFALYSLGCLILPESWQMVFCWVI